jgi:hypothetical protein
MRFCVQVYATQHRRRKGGRARESVPFIDNFRRENMKTNLSILRILAAAVVLLLIFQFFAPVLAQIRVLDTANNQQNLVVRGQFTNGTLGEVSIFGDFNNDGIADLLIGAPASNPGGRGNAGAAYVILGGSGQTSINLASANANLWVYGAEEGDILGHSVAAGDVNGDGIDDIIIGADRVNHGGENVGAVYVFLGRESQSFFSQTTALQASQANVIIYGEFAQGRFGRAVAVGDVTGNGMADLLVGAYTASPGGRMEAGALYVIQGRNTFTTQNQTVISLLSNPAHANLRIYGASGGTVSSASLTADLGYEVHPVLEDELVLNSLNATRGDRLGRSIAARNVNGTGPQDIVVGAYLASPGGRVEAGTTYVFYGNTQYQNTGNVIDLGAGGTANVAIDGINAGDNAGFYVDAGNLNGDGFGDIAIGAYRAASEAGEVYVIYGSGALPAQMNLSNQANHTIRGAAAGDRLGRSLALGDINQNGRDDLLLGASRATPLGRTQAGIGYVLYNIPPLPATILLASTTADMVQIYGASTGDLNPSSPTYCDRTLQEDGILVGDCPDELGRAIAAGDFNGDGVKDIVVGALFAKNGTSLNAGAVYIFYTGYAANQLYLPIIGREAR